jgi:signal transduction histidine kinase/ActR/RegA family two-component response regulator
MIRLLTVRIAREEDVVGARQRARQVAQALGLDAQGQTRLATAVSEMSRNAFRYAGSGAVDFSIDPDHGMLVIVISDSGPGIPHLQAVLDGTYRSTTGMGVGIVGTRRLVDEFRISSSPGRGTSVELRRSIPQRALPIGAGEVARLTESLARQQPASQHSEVEHQNHELLAALNELGQRHEELARLNAELQDTNRGVLALYSELDEKAETLQRADAMKSKFLSNMTHEFQTPLNAILALTRLLLERTDGDLQPEQEKQVQFIRDAAQNLSELVHDLLDLAKVEAGKITMRPTTFTVNDVFGALRGVIRPLQQRPEVAMVFDNADGLPPLFTDEGKLAQILRNYLSNALKFTERGEIRVSASVDADGMLLFQVKDTGIGIALEDQQRLFQEFGQVANRLQSRVRGTGLGLSLSKRLAELMGGSVGVTSAAGAGSTFWLRIPPILPGHTLAPADEPARRVIEEAPLALVVDDEQTARYVLRRCLTAIGCRVIEASGGEDALFRAAADQPDVIFLDLRMPDMLGIEVLARLKRERATADIPVIIATSQAVDGAEAQRLSNHAVAILSKARIGATNGNDEIRRAVLSAGVPLPA